LALKTLHLCVLFTGGTFGSNTDNDTCLGLRCASLQDGWKMGKQTSRPQS